MQWQRVLNPAYTQTGPKPNPRSTGSKALYTKGFPHIRKPRNGLENRYSVLLLQAKDRNPPGPMRCNDKNRVTIYTDGGSSGNPGPGGYGAVQFYDGKIKELAGGFRHTTNNRMELMGVIVALRELEYRDLPVTVYTDSSYVVNGITKGWAKKWRSNNWIKSDRQPAVNPDLWGELLDLAAELDVTFVWVKGHAGNMFNERCDELAVSSAKKKGLPEDKGYRG